MGELVTKLRTEIGRKPTTIGYYDEEIEASRSFVIPSTGKTYLIYDFGLYTEHAARIARDGNIVKYFVESSTAFPEFSNYAPGMGLDGIDKIDNFFEHVDKSDIIMFPDVDSGDLCDYLRGLGYTVYGGGLKGDDMENDRFGMRKLQFKLGLPTQRTIMVKGIANVRKFLKGELQKGEFEYIEGQEGLRDFLQQKGNVFIKLNKFRGNMESFYAKDFESVSTILDYIDVAFGPFKDTYNFIIEECKKGVEVGTDLFFNGKEFLKPYLWGYEKKSAYIGVYSDNLPYPMKKVMDTLQSYLTEINYRGAISTEMMVDEDGKPYLIDITSRFPNPLSLIYTESIKNYSDVIYNIALSNHITLDIKGKYVGCIPLKDLYALDHYVQVDINPEFKNDIKLSMGCKCNGKYFGVKGMEIVATPIAVEDSVSGVVSKLESLLSEVEAHQLQKGNMGDVFDLEKEIKEGELLGLKFQ
jgi:hypothetical protein